jgi:D-alanyl-lipoteichoic acid acyltransferase DltB (MBOAT superfamily)
MNQCDDDKKENKKEKDYKNAFEIFLSTIIIAMIIIIIIVIIVNEENVDFCEDFDILFICFVEFFASVSFLEEED